VLLKITKSKSPSTQIVDFSFLFYFLKMFILHFDFYPETSLLVQMLMNQRIMLTRHIHFSERGFFFTNKNTRVLFFSPTLSSRLPNNSGAWSWSRIHPSSHPEVPNLKLGATAHVLVCISKTLMSFTT
jgi:hypothetical protein